MSVVAVEMTRIPDRDEVLRILEEQGLEARPVDAEDWLGLELPCGEGDDACAEVLHRLETSLAQSGLPLVPLLADGRIFLRPPGD
ncbi:MAG: hypothetical protein ABR521_09925 [Gaiellaceae bacterium]